MKWKIYALRYAHREALTHEHFITNPDPHDAPMPMDYFIWLLQAGDRHVVVDTGFSEETARQRGRRLTRTVAMALMSVGVDPECVKDVVITHLHYDHAGNIGIFPRARFHLQDREMMFATGRYMTKHALRHAFEVEDVVKMVRAVHAERVQFHDGDAEICPGITLHHVGGHTDGLQMVRVDTERGAVVLASDASHFYANMNLGLPYPIVFHLGDMVEGWQRALALAEGDINRVIPGHDPEVLRRFPPLPGAEGETAQLHLPPR